MCVYDLILTVHHSNKMSILNKSVTLFASLLQLVSMIYSIVDGLQQDPGKHWNGGEHIRAYSKPRLGATVAP